MSRYEICILGKPTTDQIEGFKLRLLTASEAMGLNVPNDIKLVINPLDFKPDQRTTSTVIFFGGDATNQIEIAKLIRTNSTPVIPVASSEKRFGSEIPPDLAGINCLYYDKHGPDRLFAACLECLNLLRKQRRIFISYRRKDATAAAVQLFSELSARNFIVFLDTHRIAPAEGVGDALWHELSDADVLVMLDTPGYFESKWTNAEFGRALAKGIGVLRVQWPDQTPSIYTSTASRVEIVGSELLTDGTLAQSAIVRICSQLEQVRSLTNAVRQLAMATAVQTAAVQIGGTVDAIGTHRSIQLTLPGGKKVLLQPTLGVPTAVTLQETIERADQREAAIVYDHLGIHPEWQAHLNWLSKEVKRARWIKASEAAWILGGWDV